MAAPNGIHERRRSGTLAETLDFGSNPGALQMYGYRPPGLQRRSPLVVVLHGCTQTPEVMAQGCGWSALADRYGFALLFAGQQRSNNPNLCFNWFKPTDNRRGRGEAMSIRDMIDRAKHDFDSDPNRIFVTGLSAGGAMASVMLASYPEVFAGGAIIAGLPYGCATNTHDALRMMSQPAPRLPRVLGNLVRRASEHRGPWPRISIWHGDSDAVVAPENATEILKQWADLHDVDLSAFSLTRSKGGHSRRLWRSRGRDVIELYSLRGMGHGTPIATGTGHCGTPGPFFLDVGVSSSLRIVNFWGLAAAGSVEGDSAPQPTRTSGAPNEPASASGRYASVDEIIRRALASAGLMKRTG